MNDLNYSTNAVGSGNFESIIYAPALTVTPKVVHFKSSRGYSPYSSQGDRLYTFEGVGRRPNTDAINAIRVLAVSGNITGTFRLYGIKNS